MTVPKTCTIGVAWLLVLLCLSLPASAADLARGPLPLRLEREQLAPVRTADELILRGTVEAAQPVTVVVRIDDAASYNYPSRANLERKLPPGAFSWRINLHGLQAANGRRLDRTQLQRIIVFADPRDAAVTLHNLAAVEAQPLPVSAVGYAFGPHGAPLPPGFIRVGPDSPFIMQGKPVAITRPAPDPLLASSLRGVAALRLPWPQQGRARVTIWAEDPGEWELLPHPLRQRVVINGKTALERNLTATEWLTMRYLAGLRQEHGPQDDAWTAFGRWRGQPHTVEVEVGAKGVEIALSGDGPAAQVINAVLIEPAGQGAALEAVLMQRAAWYREHWPVIAPEPLDADAQIPATGQATLPPRRLILAPGSGGRITLALSAAQETMPDIALTPPAREETTLPARLWAGQWRVTRLNAAETLLRLSDTLLRSNASALPLAPGRPRRYDLWIDAPDTAAPGEYAGQLRVRAGAGEIVQPIIVEVLALHLPAVERPAGFYLDEAPHLRWFGNREARMQQLACDLAFLASLGIRGNAPALATPRAPAFEEFLSDMELAHRAGTAAPWLAYAPLKRVFASQGPATPSVLADVTERLASRSLPPPVWSLADEPGNADQSARGLAEQAARLRSAVGTIRLAGHLNAPGDAALALLFDVILINQGFGIDKAGMAALKRIGPEVWLYNTAQPRLTAGLWLWATGARRYLQWHARMPTADPFDPLDGREGDVQMIYPALTPCPGQPDIDRRVLDMAEGIVDGRWLAWLDAQADPQARALKTSILARLGERWTEALTLKPAQTRAIRRQIVDLAKRRTRKITQ